MAGKIFINYRRDDAAPWAGRLYERLTRDFKKSHLFIDVDNIDPGLDFVNVLEDQVAKCDVLLAVIGKGWLEATNEKGLRRLDDPDDFVRIELESALKRNVRIVPILVDGTDMPARDSLPATLQLLTRRQAWRLTHTGFGPETDGLSRALKQMPNRAPGLFARARAVTNQIDYTQYAGAVQNFEDRAEKAGKWIRTATRSPILGKYAVAAGKLLALFSCLALSSVGLGMGESEGLALVLFLIFAPFVLFLYLARRWWPFESPPKANATLAAQPSGRMMRSLAVLGKVTVILGLVFCFVSGVAVALDTSGSEAIVFAVIAIASLVALIFFWRRWILPGRKPIETAAPHTTEPPASHASIDSVIDPAPAGAAAQKN